MSDIDEQCQHEWEEGISQGIGTVWDCHKCESFTQVNPVANEKGGETMIGFNEQLKEHLLKYHLRDIQHDAEIVKLTEQNESLFNNVERLTDEIRELRDAAENYLLGSGGPNVQNLFEKLQVAIKHYTCSNCLGVGFVVDGIKQIECPDCEGEGSVDDKGYPPSYSLTQQR